MTQYSQANKRYISMLSAILAAFITLWIIAPSERSTGYSHASYIPSSLFALTEPILTPQQSENYSAIFALQEEGNWKQADALMETLENTTLKGHVLAQRYLHRDYTSSPQELEEWLQDYPDHSQAATIYALAKRKGVDEPAQPLTAKQRNLNGYGESYRNLRQEDRRWKRAMQAWKQEDYSTAQAQLTALAEDAEEMNQWDRAAIAFWNYRVHEALDQEDKAETYLEQAAQYPRSFYGAQAVQLLGDTLDDAISLHGPDTLIDQLQGTEDDIVKAALIRIDGLIKAGQYELAREELVFHYSRAQIEDRLSFARFAKALDMPALQLRMGVDLERKGITLGQALYPLPQWQPRKGYKVDPALVFAVARQESGFNHKARSYAGARGMMQLMPKTAQYVARKMKVKQRLKLNDPQTNIDLGQHYLHYLANKPYIKGNVILLAAAYNAGPGNAKRWASGDVSDPLYFIETIPFTETRDYVMNVMTNYWMYREIMNHDDSQIGLLAEGKWPKTQAQDAAKLADAGLQWSLSPRS